MTQFTRETEVLIASKDRSPLEGWEKRKKKTKKFSVGKVFKESFEDPAGRSIEGTIMKIKREGEKDDPRKKPTFDFLLLLGTMKSFRGVPEAPSGAAWV